MCVITYNHSLERSEGDTKYLSLHADVGKIEGEERRRIRFGTPLSRGRGYIPFEEDSQIKVVVSCVKTFFQDIGDTPIF